jgi:uncharacterized protein
VYLATLPSVLPLFPLPDVVLFPRMPLPLHVFEARYRKMVADALEAHRMIGMILLRPGWEPDYEGRPPVFPVGCAGPMEQCESLPDGRYRILLRGTTRFRIREEHGGQPYRLATVEPLLDSAGDLSALDDARKRVVAAIAHASDGPSVLVMQPELSHDVFANALCQTLALAPVERQSLLDCDTILERYTRLGEILQFKRLERSLGRPEGGKPH